jgi:hypothetical protein
MPGDVKGEREWRVAINRNSFQVKVYLLVWHRFKYQGGVVVYSLGLL